MVPCYIHDNIIYYHAIFYKTCCTQTGPKATLIPFLKVFILNLFLFPKSESISYSSQLGTLGTGRLG